VGLTRDELRAGLVRLAIVVAGVLGVIVGVGLLLWVVSGGPLNDALALAFSFAGCVLVAVGAGAGMTATRLGIERSQGQRRQVLRSAEDRRQRELLAYGLIGSGVASFVIALALG
jgi:hypothetical protein